MVADFPWLNSIIGGELANGADASALPFNFFYVNMNISSTYLLALAVVLLISVLGFGVIKCCKCKADSLNSFGLFLYCFFGFGVVFAATASLQGAILNTFSTFTLNLFFYILGKLYLNLGILILVLLIAECLYSLLKSKAKALWKLRLCSKAMILSAASWNPLVLICFAIFLDFTLMIAEFLETKKGKDFAYLWLTNNILCNLGLLVLVFVPDFLIAIVFCSLAVLFVVVTEIYLHFKEIALIKNQLKVNEETM